MFKILKKSLETGLVTIDYPRSAPPVSKRVRGAPRFDFARWRDARAAAECCPTGAIAVQYGDGVRHVRVDYGLCIFCGQCADADPDSAVRMTQEFELAARHRLTLITTASYALAPDGTHKALKALHEAEGAGEETAAHEELRRRIRRVLGRSLAIRQVDAGSCNGCELEIGAVNNPVYDIERFGIHFVASPRHADMLLVPGPVTRNMELALRKAYEATPEPKVVVAVGACGISGGIFGRNYATVGAVSDVLPVDVFIPGCPPQPLALLHGILLAVGRLEQKWPAP